MSEWDQVDELPPAPMTISINNEPSSGDFRISLAANFDARSTGPNLQAAQAGVRKQISDYLKRAQEYAKENFTS